MKFHIKEGDNMSTKELNEKQLKAIQLLIKGESINDVAAIIGVARQSVST